MPVKVQCSSCKKVLNAPDKAQGKTLKCPQCQSPIKIPAAKKSAEKPKQEDEFGDDFLSGLDLRHAEDRTARVCPKCGSSVKEDDVECRKCGIDLVTGEDRATKRKKKTVDTARFYKTAWGNAWAFMLKNKSYVLRTSIYTLLFTLITLGCVFMINWSSGDPPKVFWGFVCAVTALVPLGWPWFLAVSTIPVTINGKSELKHVNFDMFICVSLGIKVIVWTIVFGAPILLAFGVPAFFVYKSGNLIAAGVLGGVGLAFVYSMLPVALSHMAMPVSTPGWMINKVGAGWGKSLGGCLYTWLLIFVIALPMLGCFGGAAAGFGKRVVRVFTDVSNNSMIDAASDYKPEKDKEVPERIARYQSMDKVEVQWDNLIVPGILVGVGCLFAGPPVVFGARMMGIFTSFYKNNLDLNALERQATYVKKEPKLDKDGNPIDATETPPWLKWTAGVGGTIALYVVVNVITYNFFDGLLILPKPIARIMRLAE